MTTHIPSDTLPSSPPTAIRAEIADRARRLADRHQRRLGLAADLAAALCGFALLLIFITAHGPTAITGQAVRTAPWSDSRLIIALNMTKAGYGDQGVTVDQRNLPAVLAEVCPFLGSEQAPDLVPADPKHQAEWPAVRLLLAASGRCAQ